MRYYTVQRLYFYCQYPTNAEAAPYHAYTLGVERILYNGSFYDTALFSCMLRAAPLLGPGEVGGCDFPVGDSLDLGHGGLDHLERHEDGDMISFACV